MKKLVPMVLLSATCLSSAHAFELHSTDIKNGAMLSKTQVYAGFGCSGDNLSPALAWNGVPKGTKSFAITAYDPDAPTGSGWWHWVAYDLPADLTQLPGGIGKQAQLPADAKQGRNDFGSNDFGGACPPAGDKPHRYIFTVYALKVDKLDVPGDASPALIGFVIHANSLGQASITAKYGRK